MLLRRADVRFFRSFNFDYERKAKEGTTPEAWEENPPWFPFVRVAIEPDVTAVVGANESGKSQLLLAVKAALTGNPIERADFCRYSELYSVRDGEIRLPEFGAVLEVEETDDVAGLEFLDGATQFSFYRPGSGTPFVVVKGEKADLDEVRLTALESQLPKIHELRTDLALPDSVSIARLAGDKASSVFDRSRRTSLLGMLAGLLGTAEAELGKQLHPALQAVPGDASEEAKRRREAEFELAKTLLVKVAGVAKETFIELSKAIAEGREGQVEAIIGGINAAIRENLNIQRWWTQDREFDLLVEAREHELAFTISDRTTARYSFGERSQGLRYFLSYFVQLLAHRRENQGSDILLLDEPDAFLSSTGQHDLLRVLLEYARPESGGPDSQVIYVTHSPFLIDKNHPQRIRVLDKGAESEGTRVVRDAANNRYEPLRSSLGSHVAETAFIGGQNLFVEGLADQVLIAGMAAHLAKEDGSSDGVLDLNTVTVVASGGADSVPYLVYLARGRDAIKPACVALLDGDKSGLDAEKILRRGEARKKRVLRDEYIVRLDRWAKQSKLPFEKGFDVIEIEDLLPLGIVQRAALNHLARFQDLSQVDVGKFTVDAIRAALAKANGRVWDATLATFTAAFPDEHLEKAGLAREVISLLAIDPLADGSDQLRQRFASLLGVLSARLQEAADEEDRSRLDDRLKRAVRAFARDHTAGIRKQEARRLIREIDVALGDSDFADELRGRVQKVAREFELNDRANPNVPRFEEFRDAIKALATSERLAYQDDAGTYPAAAVLDEQEAPTEAASTSEKHDPESPAG